MVNADFQVKHHPIEITNGAMNLVEVTFFDEDGRAYWERIAVESHCGLDITLNSRLLYKHSEYIPVFFHAFCNPCYEPLRNFPQEILSSISKANIYQTGFVKGNPKAFYYLEYVGKRTKTAFFEACKAVGGCGGFAVHVPMCGWIATSYFHDDNEKYEDILDEIRTKLYHSLCFD